jgi:hypothetical protein
MVHAVGSAGTPIEIDWWLYIFPARSDGTSVVVSDGWSYSLTTWSGGGRAALWLDGKVFADGDGNALGFDFRLELLAGHAGRAPVDFVEPVRHPDRYGIRYRHDHPCGKRHREPLHAGRLCIRRLRRPAEAGHEQLFVVSRWAPRRA